MKSKDLKHPFTFETRRPLIQDRIFYVPTHYQHYDAFSFPSWEKLFGNKNPVHIEYCSGNGEWILRKAEENPEINWIAVEVKFGRVRKIHSKRTKQKVKNLFIVCGRAQVLTSEYLQENSVDAIYINFPDPWPKGRHAKHRLVQASFMQDAFRIIKPKGKVLLVSDAIGYVDQMKEEVGKVMDWRECEVDTDRKASYGSSYFDCLWRSMGRSVYFLEYQCVK